MYSKERADAACNFFELVLKHTADEWYGKPFLLAPWEEQALQRIFGEIDEDGLRIIEMAYLEVPKKSGKSEFVAGIILLILLLDPMPGCQIYGAASATRQALNVFRAACKMVEQSPILKSRLRILRSTNRIIKRSDPDSFYAAIAADGDLGDGVNPAVVVADEVHRWKTRKQLENWDVLVNGGITRRQTLTIAITTAGVQNESPLAWRLHEKTKRIEAGLVSDPKFYGKIYGADKDDDPGDEETWKKAHPSLTCNGGFLPIEKLRQKYESLKAEGDLTSWKRYFLNIWDQKENLAISVATWDAGAGPWTAAGLVKAPAPLLVGGKEVERRVRPLPHNLQSRFIDRQCFAGVDLSMTTDFSSVVFLFPNDDGDSYDVLAFFWMPEKDRDGHDFPRTMERKLGVPLRKWVEEGFIEVSPGPVIDYRDVRARLDWGRQMFDLQEVCFDPYNSRQLSVQMIEDGFNCKEVKQSFSMLTEPTKKILQLVVSKKLHHGGNPMLRFNAGCAVTVDDKRDNIMFDKPARATAASRIDGLSALACAMAGAIVAEQSTAMYTGMRSV